MAFQTKVYVVQKFDRDGHPGPVIAVKTAWGPAHAVAKEHAPCKVVAVTADKTLIANVAPDPRMVQPVCNQLHCPRRSLV